jgi:T-complex protein 1 subunit theta
MAYNTAAGLGGMLQSGSRHYSQEDDGGAGGVVLRNIDACLQLSRMLSTSMGPQGRCKLVVNHLGQLNVTSDCASILKDVMVEHPAAQLLASACQKQEEEYGDNTNFVLAFGGELLFETAKLIGKMTWQPGPEIIAGYQRALKLCTESYLPELLVPGAVLDVSQRDDLLKLLKPVLASKQYDSHDHIAPLVADACLQVMNRSSNNSNEPRIPIEAVRTVKILGSSVDQSILIAGFVAKSGLETVARSATNCKVAVYASGFEASSTEAKGTVLMKNAADLLNYNKTEEAKMQDIVAGIAEAGVQVIVTGGNLSDMALHFIDQYQLLCLRVGSKWELRRLCQAIGATALVRLGTPTPDELGHAASVRQMEVGGKTLTVFTKDDGDGVKGGGSDVNSIATILLRASTHTVLNDLERAVDDGVHAVAAAAKDPRLVYGGGAVETALSVRLLKEAARTPGLEQYALAAFARALQIVPRTLAQNAGLNANEVMADLMAAHDIHGDDGEGNTATTTTTDTTTAPPLPKNISVGVLIDRDRVETPVPSTTTMTTTTGPLVDVADVLATKQAALMLAVDAAVTILKIDQIIMSKPAGGPSPQR